ncbi:UbiA prenyltransferase family protein [Plantactinospora sp. WMMB782]|uniref:UbiA prenyltransferase family protein n=1 Tax=Plantactinospora sp. WMMB782 TaxID=3404121 RepID=UPI003B935131
MQTVDATQTVDTSPPTASGGPLVVQPAGVAPTVLPAPVLAPPPAGLFRDLLRLARPHQWPKNLLVVPLALIDAPGLTLAGLARVGWAVLVFTLASALVYVWNDAVDRHRDRAHPVKRHRPIASGRIGLPLAWAYGGILTGLLLAAVFAGPAVPWWPLAAYLVLNVAYSRWLKYVPLVDVFVVAAGFVLRAVQGYVAAGTDISSWLLIAVFALCLLLILGKRRNELAVSGTEHRPALSAYSAQYLEYLIVLCATLAVTAFLFYLADGGLVTPYTDVALLVSVPFATFGLARYLQVVVVHREGGDPVRVLLRDRMMVVNAVLWAALLGLVVLAARFPALVEVLR